MRSIIKRSYQEFVDYIDFPTVIYIYETGSILAVNDYAKNILGSDMKNISEIWQNQVRQKFNRKLLNNGSEIIYNKIIDLDGGKQEIDMEVNVFFQDKNHVIFCFFELTQKHYFTEHLKNQVPRMIWKDESLTLLGASCYSRLDLNIEGDITPLQNQNLLEDELSHKLKMDDIGIIQSGSNHYNVMEEFKVRDRDSFFVRLHRLPIINRSEQVCGLIYVYTLILNQEEKNNLIQNTLKENVILKEVVSKSGTIIVRWNTDSDWSIEYISPNIIKYGYNASDFHSRKILWKDIIHPDDYLRVYSIHMMENSNVVLEDKPLTLEYRILTSDREVIWVREESIAIRENNMNCYREGVVNDITYEKELEKELLENKEIFKIKMDDVIVSNKGYESINFWDLLDLKHMKLLQETIENLTGIWNFLVDQKGNIVTEVVVKKSLKDTVYKNLSMYKYITYIKEFIKESMEIKKPVTKYFLDNSFAVTAIPFFFGEKKIGAWFLIGINNNKAIEKEYHEELRFLSEAKNINKKSYDKIMLFLWSYVKGICNTIVGNLDLIEEKKNLKETSLKYEKQLEKTKMITKILQLANLERPYVEVLNNIFNNIVSFCDFEKVIIYESNATENQIMIQYEWHLGEGMPKGRKNRQIADKMPYIHNVLQGKGGFVQLYEMDDNEEFNELFQNTKVSAAAIAQLTLNYFNDSIIIFTNSKENNRWKDYEISLFREILPIIQNVFVKAREAERFLRNKNTLYEMLNNLDSTVFIISKENSEILYVNNLAITNFGIELIGIPFFEVCNNLRIDLYQNFRDVREFCSLEGNYKCYEQGRNRHLLIQSKEIQWFDGQNALAIYIKDMNEALFQLKNEFSFLFNEK